MSRSLKPQSTWVIHVPCDLTPSRPLFNMGDFVPMERQPRPETTVYFGRIVGLWVDRYCDAPHEWIYLVEYPDDHPQAALDDWDTPMPESCITQLITVYGILESPPSARLLQLCG